MLQIGLLCYRRSISFNGVNVMALVTDITCLSVSLRPDDRLLNAHLAVAR